MYNGTALEAWSALPKIPTTVLTAAALGLGIFLTVILSPLYSSSKTGVRELRGLSIVAAWAFFNRRFDFLKENFSKVGDDMFTFKVLQHRVTAMKGHEARAAFFNNRVLNFIEGYRILQGGVPRLEDIGEDALNETGAWFSGHLTSLLKKERLNDFLPILLSDIQERMNGWGEQGQMDPFKNIYDLIVQMTTRMATCAELADNMEVVDELKENFWTVERSANAITQLLPWLPSKATKRKDNATRALYKKLFDVIEKKRSAGASSMDTIDILINKGLKNHEMIPFIFGVVFAGLANSGMAACWALVFLSVHKEWKAKALAEIKTIIENHTDTVSEEPLHKRLAAIPISVWEDEMPVLELIIRETIRMIFNIATLRRNITRDIEVSGKIIPAGSFVAYPVSDVHLNPEIYTNPTEFDPTRYYPDRQEDKKHTFAYLGWGAGRHPCTGMKFAKLELKLIMTMFLAGYEYDIVDAAGNSPDRLPVPNRNDYQQARPIGNPCFFRYTRVSK